MPPVVMRNRMRTRSASRTDAAAESSMTKSSPTTKHQSPPLRHQEVDDDNVMSPRELARAIAEFRVGVPFSTPTIDSKEENFKNRNADESNKMDTPLDQNASSEELSPKTPSPEDKRASSDPLDANLPANPTQASHTMPYNLETNGSPIVGNAASEEPSSGCPTRPHRRGFTSSERDLLEAAFHISDHPGTATMKLLVHLTGLDSKKIRGWFRSRRLRQEREEAKAGRTSPSETEPKHQVPPQYWPEPLRTFSHMQRPHQVPGHSYIAPLGLPTVPGVPIVAPGIPSMAPPMPSKVPSGFLYPPLPPSSIPTMGFLPPPMPPPGHWYHPMGFNTNQPPHPLAKRDNPLSSGSASKTPSTTEASKAPTAPWCKSSGIEHPLQGVIPPPTGNPLPSGLPNAGLIHPWSSLGYYPAPGIHPQHPGTGPYPSHPAIPYCNPWYPMLPPPQKPLHIQTGSQAPSSAMATSSNSQIVKLSPSDMEHTRQEVSETDSEATTNE
ncbi:uncharacterized protein LOC129264461 [Lytechinus pictus]|uniref:uncharacterized protein LOC129264461 n=1 Tax=Lytechinus pictus TaxID=7653 RepID=UPI0030B9C540